MKGYDRNVALRLQVPPAEAKRKESSPYLLYAAVLLVVGVSAVLPVVLLREGSGEAIVSVDGGPTPATAVVVASVVQTAPLPVAAAIVAPSPDADAGPRAVTTAPATASAAASAKPVASAEANGPGFLTIRTTPPSRVTEHGRVLCTTTPCAKLPLPAGTHSITLENKEEAMKTTIVVTITSGEITSKRVTLK